MAKAILLSIHPRYVEKILSGEKIYELRKVKPSHKVNKIYIYATAPVAKIVACADVEEVIVDTPEILWEKTKVNSGVSKDSFFDYYQDKSEAVAFKLMKIKKLEQEKRLIDFGVKNAPQSFIYLNIEDNDKILAFNKINQNKT